MRRSGPRAVVWWRLVGVLGGLVTAWGAGAQVVTPAALPAPPASAAPAERLAERSRLMREGEAALAELRVEQALHRFERAALIEHAADIEMALVRTHMQAGNYRQAVSFSAHTAGAHRQVPEGAALYAWLLAVGGQQAAALRLLDDAEQRFAGHAFLGATRQLIATPAAEATGALTNGAARLQPYASPTLRSPARVVSSGVLIDNGRRALVPLRALAAGAQRLQVRNGLGLGAVARVEQRLPALGLAVLKLDAPLQAQGLSRALGDSGEPLALPAAAERDPFPGSPGYAVTFVSPSSHLAPAWPRLHLGFHGMPVGSDGQRLLGIDTPPGSRGGPVFDAQGHWVGVALTQPDGSAQMVPVSRLKSSLGDKLGAPAATAPGEKMPVDAVYEAALRSTLQVIAGS